MSRLLLGLLFLLQTPVAQQAENGSAAGQIRTLNGESMANIRVAAIAIPAPNAPAGNLEMRSLAITDSAGRYRLQNIPPGRYYIQAGLIDAPSYFPGVTSINAAASILISAGTAVEGLDFTVVQPQGVKVSGRIPIVNGQPVSISMRSRSRPLGLSPETRTDGTFEFLRVPPGEYQLSGVGVPTLTVVVSDKDVVVGIVPGTGVKLSGVVGLGANSPRVPNQKVALQGSTAWVQDEAAIDASGRFEFPGIPNGAYTLRIVPGFASAVATIMVGNTDIAGLVLPAPTEITGVVVMEAEASLMIVAKGTDDKAFSTAVKRDGTFRLPIAEGEYQLSTSKLPAGLALKSMTYGTTDLLNEPLKLDGQSAPQQIRVMLGTN
jgi:hypothetical protein